MPNNPTLPVTVAPAQQAPAAPAPDVFADAFASSQAGHPVSTDAKTADPFANAFSDSIAGRPAASAVTTTPPEPTTLENVGAGVKEGADDIWGQVKNVAGLLTSSGAMAAAKGIWHQLPPVELADSVKQTLPLIDTYEKSRANGASVGDAIKAVDATARQHASNVSALPAVVKAFRENPTRESARALTDAAALAASFLVGGGETAAAPEAEAAAVAPAAEAVESPSLLQRVQRAVSPTAAAQPEAQAALREGAAATAKDAGVAAPVVNAPGAGIRTLMEKPIAEAAKIEDGLYTSVNKAAETDMKSLYDRQEELQDAIDDPTNVHQKPALQAELKTTQADIATGETKVQSALGDDASKLINQAKAATQQRYSMETGDAKLFNNESVVKGNVAHGSDETINVDSAIREAEKLDKPSKFAPRGTPTRLQQMFGEGGAKDFKQGLYDAQKSGKTVLTRNKVLGFLGGAGSLEILHLVTR